MNVFKVVISMGFAIVLAAGGAQAQEGGEVSADSIIDFFNAGAGGAAEDCSAGDCVAKSGTRGLAVGGAKPAPAPRATAPQPAAAPAPQPAAAPAPAPATVATAPQPQPASQGFNLLITFELGSFALTPQARRNLEEFARAITDPRLANARFTIAGHTDASGPEDLNMRLSERRADAVVDFLTARGIDRSRLVARGFGESSPMTANPFDGANRRVEAQLLSR
jgi:outer membrane protein OmpA-like peptidoglycan-associated protein